MTDNDLNASKDKTAGKGNKSRIVFILLYFIFFISIPAGVSYWLSDNSSKYGFDARPVESLEQMQPRFIFFGNSMLRTRIDQRLLKRLTQNPRLYFFAKDGMMSAYWYLALKNYVAAAKINPEKVFIMFRDEFLTRPKINIDGKFKKTIDSVSHADESLFRYIVSSPKTFKEKLSYYLERIYPALGAGAEYRDLLSQIAGAVGGFGGNHLKELLGTVNKRFNWGNIRYDGPQDERWWRTTPEHLDFEKNLHWSFLPHILRLAKENHFKLVFVRIQTRPPKEGQPPPQSPELKNYISHLKKYLKKNNAGFYDFTGHPWITLSMYSLTDHIHKRFKKKWTRLFYKKLREELQ